MYINEETIGRVITVIATVISTIIATLALIISVKQIKQSNTQKLFDMRMENYIVLKGLLELYKESQNTIEENKKDEPYFLCNITFTWLVNNSYLESCNSVINEKVNEKDQKNFLCKMEDLKNVSIKLGFLFDNNVSKIAEEFIESYRELLIELYHYKITINCMSELSAKYNNTLEEAIKKTNETKYRNELYLKFENLIKAYKNIKENDVEKQMEKTIKIK